MSDTLYFGLLIMNLIGILGAIHCICTYGNKHNIKVNSAAVHNLHNVIGEIINLIK